MSDPVSAISVALHERRPLEALRLYEAALKSAHSHDVKRRFEQTMILLGVARRLDFDELPVRHAAARRDDRRRVRAATIDRLIELKDDEKALAAIGRHWERLVLEGSLQQHFWCKVAADFAYAGAVPPLVRDKVLEPLIDALRVVLRVGAPSTRDEAIEGLGALLKQFEHPADEMKPDERVQPAREATEKEADFAARRAVSDDYFDRLDRRRLMALTIAGDVAARQEFADKLSEPIAEVIARIRQDGGDWAARIGDALWERSDLLRILPAVTRQRQSGGPLLPTKPAALLIDAAQRLTAEAGDPPEVAIAMARHQESVFRTIEVAIRRDWDWEKFDDVIAEAVRGIPRTVPGSPAMANAEIRATISILRTAVRMLRYGADRPSWTREALRELFERIDWEPALWTNPGIAEGCFRALPDLVGDASFQDLIRPAVRALFVQLETVPSPNDLVHAHRRLILNSCFRRILLSLADRFQERLMSGLETDREQLDRDLRLILRFPTVANLQTIAVRGGAQAADSGPLDLGEAVIAGIAFESDLLRQSESLFKRWPNLPTIKKVLLLRILAGQLHTFSRDLPQLRRHPILHRVFVEMPGVALEDTDAMSLIWRLLSSLPPEAADAAEMEIQRFVEFRGRRTGAAGRKAVEDLPGYVLAMISPIASGRIAGAIAREIDLNLRRDRGTPGADCAKYLHQVMLRGPHESIFDHLIPRVEPEERPVVMLFRRHVGNVRRAARDDKTFDLPEIRTHVGQLIKDLKDSKGILAELRTALELYRDLTGGPEPDPATRNHVNAQETSAADEENTEPDPKEKVWDLIAGGETLTLFKMLDRLAKATEHSPLRASLEETYDQQLNDLQEEVTHYVTLPVGDFAARTSALRKASEITDDVEKALQEKHSGLEPPERVLLVALMQHFRALFEATIRWFCIEPRRRIHEKKEHVKATDEFWHFFCDPGSPDARTESLIRLVKDGPRQANVVRGLEVEDQIERFKRLIGDEPPRFTNQREKFEEFFVKWRAADLDVATLKERLWDRWPPLFRSIYDTVTNLGRMTIIILVICAWAIAMDLTGEHDLEGLGFLIVSVLAIGSTGLTLAEDIRSAVKRIRRKKRPLEKRRIKRGYWFQSFLPRLVRLTVVPMALIVEFNHSYEFPLCGSTWVLLLLMVLSFLTTRFFVTREIVDQTERPGEVEITKHERQKANQIVSLALAHSFSIAVVLAAIFASSHPHGGGCERNESPVHASFQETAAPEEPEPLPSLADVILERFDEVPEQHSYTRFMGFLPRDVAVDLNEFVTLPRKVEEHAVFTFYPTIILTWTALGLFLGVFLEGFMKGARLRGAADDATAESE